MYNLVAGYIFLSAAYISWPIIKIGSSYLLTKILGKYLFNYMCNLVFRSKDIHKKTITIEKITDERQLNPLYSPIAWFLMNQVNLDEEDRIKLIIDEKINEKTVKIPKISRRVTQDLDRVMKFEGREIHYKLSARSVDVDGEKHSSTRRNDTITCWIETNWKEDTFLEHFAKVCMEQYHGNVISKTIKRNVYQNMNGAWMSVCEQSERMVDTIVLKDNRKEILLDEVNHFINNKDWYTTHGFLYSLGILLHGKPGTGKTTIIRYLATVTRRNTHYLRLGQIKDENEFNKLLKDIDLSKTVLVMEDIDCAGKMVHDRVRKIKDDIKEDDLDSDNEEKPNKKKKKKDKHKDAITLDILLNVLDGILTVPGQIVVMTTNHKDVLDDALIRPGRIDVNLELTKCDIDMIIRLTKKFYGIEELPFGVITNIRNIREDTFSPAYVMNVFRRYKNDMVKAIITLAEDIDGEFEKNG